MPLQAPSVIIVGNDNISPWLADNKSIRSQNINHLRSIFRETRNRNKIRNIANNSHNIALSRMANDFCLAKNVMPPKRTTMDRVWRDYLFPNREYFFGVEQINNVTVQYLAENFKFHEYSNTQILSNEDIYNYKYCVMLAGFNIINSIFKNYYHDFPIKYIYIDKNYISSHSAFSLYVHSCKLCINDINLFLLIMNSIPIFTQSNQINDDCMSYLVFWNYIWNIYFDFSIDTRHIVTNNNINQNNENNNTNQNDKNKNKIISIIEKSKISDSILNSIYNIILFS